MRATSHVRRQYDNVVSAYHVKDLSITVPWVRHEGGSQPIYESALFLGIQPASVRAGALLYWC